MYALNLIPLLIVLFIFLVIIKKMAPEEPLLKPYFLLVILAVSSTVTKEVNLEFISGSPIPLNFDRVLIPAIFFVTLYRWGKAPEKYYPFKNRTIKIYGAFVFAFLFIGLLSSSKLLFLSLPSSLDSTLRLIQFVMYLFIPICASVLIDNVKQLKLILTSLLLSWGFMTIYWIWFYYGGPVPTYFERNPLATAQYSMGAKRLRGFWAQEGMAIGYFSAIHVLVWTAYVLHVRKTWYINILRGILIIGGIFTVILPYGRAAWLGFLVGFPVLFRKYIYAFFTNKKVLISLIVLILIIGSYLSYPYLTGYDSPNIDLTEKPIKGQLRDDPLPVKINRRILSIYYFGARQFKKYVLEDQSVDTRHKNPRIFKWLEAGKYIAQHPIVGTGFVHHAKSYGYKYAADSGYVDLLLFLGFSGFFCWFVIMGIILKMSDFILTHPDIFPYHFLGGGVYAIFFGLFGLLVGGGIWGRWRILSHVFLYTGLVFYLLQSNQYSRRNT